MEGEGWLRICADCAVSIAEQAVQAPSADVEAVATQMHVLLQQVERQRAVERAREEQSLFNVAKRNVKLLMEQRAEANAAFWTDWANGGMNDALIKQTT